MLARRASRTVVLLAHDRTLRADVSGTRAPRISYSSSRSASERSPEARLSEVLDGTRPAPQLLVLLEAAWTQTLDLATSALEGLAHKEVEHLLAYELEPLTAIPPQESVIAYLTLSESSGRTRLWVTAVARATRESLEAAARAAGTRLVGLSHPAGLAQVETDEVAVEVWEGATWCFAREETLVLGARAGQRSWAQGVGAWLERVPDDRTLRWSGRARPSQLTLALPPRELSDEGPEPALAAGPERLLAAARAESEEARRFPLIGPTPRARFAPRPMPVSLFLILLVVGLGAADLTRTVEAAEQLELSASAAEKVREAFELEKQRESRLTLRRAELRTREEQELGRLARIEECWRTQAARLPALLDALGAGRPEGLVVLGIDEQGAGGVAIAGKALQTSPVNAFVADLGRRLTGAGWEVQPPRTIEAQAPGGATYQDFVISVIPCSASSAPRVTPKRSGR